MIRYLFPTGCPTPTLLPANAALSDGVAPLLTITIGAYQLRCRIAAMYV